MPSTSLLLFCSLCCLVSVPYFTAFFLCPHSPLPLQSPASVPCSVASFPYPDKSLSAVPSSCHLFLYSSSSTCLPSCSSISILYLFSPSPSLMPHQQPLKQLLCSCILHTTSFNFCKWPSQRSHCFCAWFLPAHIPVVKLSHVLCSVYHCISVANKLLHQ